MGSQTDLDQGGTYRQLDKVYMGPSVGWIVRPEAALLPIIAAGTYAIARGTTLITLTPNGVVNINLPSSLASAAGPQAIPGQFVLNSVTIVDIGGFAGGGNYLINPFGAELISSLAQVELASPYGSIILKPILETGGWTLLQ
jgi:hypothetical protein